MAAPLPDTSIWTTLLPVMVGGAIGVAGSFFGPWFNEKKKKRAEKIEELVTAVYEFDHWVDKYRNVTAFGDPGEIGLSPMAKMEAIAAVHFPVFLDKISAVDEAANKYVVWILAAAQKRLDGKIKEINEGFAEASRPYLQRRNDLLDELKEFAGKQLK